jgi:hypothetical protein
MTRTVTVSATAPEWFLNGIESGQSKRANLDLDRIDRSTDNVTLEFTTPVVTSTFIEGLVGPSIDALGYSGFKEKYRIEGTRPVVENVLAMAQFLEDTKAK